MQVRMYVHATQVIRPLSKRQRFLALIDIFSKNQV